MKTRVINRLVYMVLVIIMGIEVINLASKLTLISVIKQKYNSVNKIKLKNANRCNSVYASLVLIDGKKTLNIINNKQTFMLISQAKKLLMHRYKLYNVNADNIKLKNSILIKRNKVNKSSISSYNDALKKIVSTLSLKWEERVVNYSKIPYNIKVDTSSKILKGTTSVMQNGAEGKKMEQSVLEMNDGKIVRKKLLVSKVLREPIAEQKVVGTAEPVATDNIYKSPASRQNDFNSKSVASFSSMENSTETKQPRAGNLAVDISGVESTFSKPVIGFLSSKFGMRWGKMHSGVDLGADYGQDIRAAYSGRVVYSAWCEGYGNLIEIEHDNEYSTYYGHCSAILVTNGEQVSKGQVIGRVGSTGHSTGPHLHFEVRKDGVPINPWPFIRNYYV